MCEPEPLRPAGLNVVNDESIGGGFLRRIISPQRQSSELRLKLLLHSALGALLVLLIGCGSGSAGSTTPLRSAKRGVGKPGQGRGQGTVRRVGWGGQPTGARQFTLFAYPPYCSHGPKPHVEKVGIRRKFRRVVLSVYMHFPSPAHPCLGEVIGVKKVVHLNFPVRQLAFYDGSQSPPAQRWPG
jgi:hypothetical protein